MVPKMSSLIGVQCPPDGFTDEENLIGRLLFENTVLSIYSKLPTARMKAIVALHFELGYTQDIVANMFKISQPRINEEIRNIRKILTGLPFRARKEKSKVGVKDLLSVCLQLTRS